MAPREDFGPGLEAIAVVRDWEADKEVQNMAWSWRVFFDGADIGLMRIDVHILNRLNQRELEMMVLREAVRFLSSHAEARAKWSET